MLEWIRSGLEKAGSFLKKGKNGSSSVCWLLLKSNFDCWPSALSLTNPHRTSNSLLPVPSSYGIYIPRGKFAYNDFPTCSLIIDRKIVGEREEIFLKTFDSRENRFLCTHTRTHTSSYTAKLTRFDSTPRWDEMKTLLRADWTTTEVPRTKGNYYRFLRFLVNLSS